MLKNRGIIKILSKNRTPKIITLDQFEVGYRNESEITSPISINILHNYHFNKISVTTVLKMLLIYFLSS